MKPSDIGLVSILVAHPTLTVEEAACTVAMRRTVAPMEKQSGRFPARPTSRNADVRAFYQMVMTPRDWSN